MLRTDFSGATLMLLAAKQTELCTSEFVAQHGEIFAVFDSATQDSGNISYGVRAENVRLFVKTAGDPHDARAFLSHEERVALLRNAMCLGRSVSDAALPKLRNAVESVEGPLLVYEWVEGELVGTSRSRRSDPTSAYARFRGLPVPELVAALDTVFRLHVKLAHQGWIACDFYDGCLVYDFTRHNMHVVDLDHYRDRPFTNQMGRMFGSTRFMAPEEHTLGTRIDERTTVFTMGRTVQQLFPSAGDSLRDVASRACEPNPQLRFENLGQFYDAWSAAARTGSGSNRPRC